MLRKKHIMLGLIIFTLCIMVLSGCGGGKGGNGGGNVTVDFDPAAFEDTTWECEASGDRPKITVYIGEFVEKDGIQCYFTGSVYSDTTGEMSITEADISERNIGRYLQLIATKVAGKTMIAFNVSSTNHNEDHIQIDGYIWADDPDTLTVAYLLVDYYDEMYSDYEYDEEYDPEVVEFVKIL